MVRVTEYESSGLERIRWIGSIANAIAIQIATGTTVVTVAIVTREGQVPMVGSYLSERAMDVSDQYAHSQMLEEGDKGSVTHESIDYGPAVR